MILIFFHKVSPNGINEQKKTLKKQLYEYKTISLEFYLIVNQGYYFEGISTALFFLILANISIGTK